MNETLDILLNHSSVRKYTNESVKSEIVDLIIQAGQMAPSSSNFQAYTIIEVKDQERRNAIYEASGRQEWILNAPLLLLFCGDLDRGKSYYSGVKDREIFTNTESFLVATIDTALVAQKVLIAAQSLGLGGVFIGGIRNDMEKISKSFDLPNFVFPLFAMCIGYPDENNGVKPRLPKEVIHKIDSYISSKEEKLIKEYDEINYKYYYERTNGQHPETWTERSGKAITAKPRYGVGVFLREKGLLKK